MAFFVLMQPPFSDWNSELFRLRIFFLEINPCWVFFHLNVPLLSAEVMSSLVDFFPAFIPRYLGTCFPSSHASSSTLLSPFPHFSCDIYVGDFRDKHPFAFGESF